MRWTQQKRIMWVHKLLMMMDNMLYYFNNWIKIIKAHSNKIRCKTSNKKQISVNYECNKKLIWFKKNLWAVPRIEKEEVLLA
jgi:hypothetical protein